MDTRQLRTPITDSGITSTHFFNGQLLSGEDLTREKQSNQHARRLLGRAIGAGIVSGLEVRYEPTVDAAAKTVVSIQPGIALNREGQIVQIEQTIYLNLEPEPETNDNTASEAFFVPCPNFVAEEGTYVADPTLYLLTMMPVEVRRGRAIVNGLHNRGVNCNQKTVIDGVQFRLLALDLQPGELTATNLPMLRNRVAYRAFGIEDAGYTSFFSDPFTTPETEYGLLDSLRGGRLYDCDIPLALIFGTAADGLVFVDNWSVRRRATPPDLTTAPLFAPRRRVSETEAMMLQFQEHIADLRTEQRAEMGLLQLRSHCRYIPPAGVIPLRNRSDNSSDSTRPFGATFTEFFRNINYRQRVNNETIVVEASRVRAIMHTALHYAPVDLDKEEMIWIYSVAENLKAIDTADGNTPQQYVLYTTGHMPYMGDPHYDVNRFDYSNFF